MGTKAWIIITDLDASLLDESYSYKDAIDALDFIHKSEIPLVLNSSKTFPFQIERKMERIQYQLLVKQIYHLYTI